MHYVPSVQYYIYVKNVTQREPIIEHLNLLSMFLLFNPLLPYSSF